MRARNIKPGFFKNETLGEIGAAGMILFAGLWCMADREGRLEDRPKRIKVEVLPYDNTSVDKLLKALSDSGFIRRYSVNSCKYIQIINFRKHQNPHIKEAASSIPAPDENSISTVQEPEKHRSRPADSLIPDSLIPDSGFSDSKDSLIKEGGEVEGQKKRFGEFVKLTESQHLTLIQKFGEAGTRERIEDLDIYIGKIGAQSAGKKYKSHYHTILAFDRMGQGRARENGGTPRAAPRPKCYEEVKIPKEKEWTGPIPEAVKRMIGKIGG